MHSSPTTRRPHLPRRAFACGLVSLAALSACANPRLFARNIRALSPNFTGSVPRSFTRDQVAQFSAASVELHVGHGLPQLLLLTQLNGLDHLWGTRGQTILQTRGARLIATGGLAADLSGTQLVSADPAESSLLVANGAACVRLLDFADSYGIGLRAESVFQVEGIETLEILGARLETKRVVERVHVADIKWRHTNKFWIDSKTGLVWLSQQHAHPDIAALTIKTLRPALA